MTDHPETCPSLCVERSHPGREHDPATDGCYCWELCGMGPTCPGANAGLPRGCWRTLPAEPTVTPSDPTALTDAEREELWRHVKIAPSIHDREQIETAVENILSARTANLRAVLGVVDSLTTAAEYRAQVSLSRDFEGNPPAALVPASDLRAALVNAPAEDDETPETEEQP